MTPEDIKTVQNELNTLFSTLQRIEAPMSENNVAVMNACLGSIKFVYNMIKNSTKGDAKNGNADAE